MAIIAVFLAYLMLPGSIELAEAAVHLVVHGDTAHGGSDGHEDAGPGDEHGCSGGYHVCVCHHTTGFIVPRSSGTAALETAGQTDTPPAVESHVGDFVELIFRPPIG